MYVSWRPDRMHVSFAVKSYSNDCIMHEGVFDSKTNSIRTQTIHRVEMNRGLSKAKLSDNTQDFRVGISEASLRYQR